MFAWYLTLTARTLSSWRNHAQAETLFKRALAIREKVLGPEHPDTARSLIDLAGLYERQGRYGDAELLYKRALAIREKVLGPLHPDTASSLINFGNLYKLQGKDWEANTLIKQSQDVILNSLTKDNGIIAGRRLVNISASYASHGYFSLSEELLQRSIIIFEKAGKEDNLIYPLYTLANVQRVLGRYSEAERNLKRSLGIMEKIMGVHNIATNLQQAGLVRMYIDQGRYGEAVPLLQRMNRNNLNWLVREVPLLPREDRSSLIDKNHDKDNIIFELLDRSPTGTPLALETQLNRQGLLAEIERLQALLTSSSLETRQLAEQVGSIDRQLASESLAPGLRKSMLLQRPD